MQQLDRRAAVLGLDLGQLAALLGGVDVAHEPVLVGCSGRSRSATRRARRGRCGRPRPTLTRSCPARRPTRAARPRAPETPRPTGRRTAAGPRWARCPGPAPVIGGGQQRDLQTRARAPPRRARSPSRWARGTASRRADGGRSETRRRRRSRPPPSARTRARRRRASTSGSWLAASAYIAVRQLQKSSPVGGSVAGPTAARRSRAGRAGRRGCGRWPSRDRGAAVRVQPRHERSRSAAASSRTYTGSPPTKAIGHRDRGRSGRRASRPGRRAAADRRACRPRSSPRSCCTSSVQAALSVAAPSSSRTLMPYSRAASPSTTGIENTGAVPGLPSVASTTIAPASSSARAGARCSAPRNSAAGSSTAAHGAAASGSDVLGVDRREVVDRARARGQRHRHRPHGRRTARRGSAAPGRRRPPARPSAPGARCRTRSTRRRCRAPTPSRRQHLGHHRLDLAHPPVGRPAVGHRVGEQRRRERRLDDLRHRARGQGAARASRPRARARSRTCTRTSSCRRRASRRR